MKYKFVVIDKGYKSTIKEFDELKKEEIIERFNKKYKNKERWYFEIGRKR